MDKKPLKVAMVCHFSNPKVQQKLKLKLNILEYIERKLKHLPTNPYKFIGESHVWVGNAIEEYEKNTNDIELHVISPHDNMASDIQEFKINGINYHFFQNEDRLPSFRLKKLLSSSFPKYERNRKKIIQLIKDAKPDIVYMIGIENPLYALAALDISEDIPLFIQLQTLMCDPDFEKNYPIKHDEYVYRSSTEIEVIKRANFIGTSIEKMANIIRRDVKPDALILKTKLAVGEKIYNENVEKKYDFVYFAADINKAFDLALEGFAIAHQKYPNLTMLVIGKYDDIYKKKMDVRISELGIKNHITFTGRLPTHDDVLKKIREAKYGLLPLKIDIVSGTLRECMANGLPVVTTITDGGTPILNEKRETVLLSPIGDHNALAENMLRLLNDKDLEKKLRTNGFERIRELYSNESIVSLQKEALFAEVDYFKKGTQIPKNLLT